MNTTPHELNEIARAIQLALGPVFLLTGVGSLLNVMSGRLSRIIDRGRFLTEKPVNSFDPVKVEAELRSLELRRHYTSVAITMCTISALLVCLVVVALFVDVMLLVPLYWMIGVLFIIATLTLVVGLAFFLGEVHLSAKHVRLR